MTEVPLIAGYSEGTIQWKAEVLQMINWGGFHGGPHRVDFAPGATLISGASGTGKSTLLDAYIALMMPSSVPFNGASNDATTGRARGADQRNVLTYLRGKRDATRDGDMLTDQVLRGDGVPVWGALAMTFVDERDQRFTVMRAYFAQPGLQRSADVMTRMFTLSGTFDLADLADFAESRFDPRRLRSRFTGLVYHDTATKFIDTVTTKLGIGANGNGDNALRLLARIQAGHQVRTVDSLYKQLVLEEPGTYRAADRASEQFESLDQAYRDLETDGEKERHLHGVGELYADYERSRDQAARLDRFGVARPGQDTPFRLWQLRTEYRLLTDAEVANATRRKTVRDRMLDAAEQVNDLAAEVKQIEEQQRANGGGALESLDAHADQVRLKRDRAVQTRTEFLLRIKPLALAITDQAAFEQAREAARTFMSGADETERSLTHRRDALIQAQPQLEERRALLEEERQSLQTREGRVPLAFDKARRQIAEACGLSPRDLPFAAELMDVRPDFERWRLAAELTLRGIGLTLLMDERRQSHIRETIETLDLHPRVSFEGVALNDQAPDPSEARYISGRLAFKDSPFTGWVKRRVSRPGTDHLCVDDPSELGGQDPKVTIHGQVSRGARGAHGRNPGQQFVLGFSNESRLAEIAAEITRVQRELDDNDHACKTLEEQHRTLRAKQEASQAVVTTAWESIDVDSAEAELARLEAERAELLANSDVLAALTQRHKDASERLEAARKQYFARDHELTQLLKTQERIVDRQDCVTREQDTIERTGLIVLADEDDRHLSQLLDERDHGVDDQGFADAAEHLRRDLAQESARERERSRRSAEQLATIFAMYNQRWPDPNRGETVEAYPEFAAIYDEIVKHGLFERREAFKRQFQKWSGDDLLLLNDAFDRSLADIEERLEPINEILGHLPFGAQHDRLQIVLRHLRPERLASFRKQLRELSSNVAVEWTQEQTDERFHRLREFMTLLAKPDTGSSAGRDDLLDVRKHIEITAARVDAGGREISTYSVLGGKSGGESQELVAFIVGAALRYQLGDETRTKPRFAPVFLDEGFVKSDSEFAGRAVNAWRELGFQLIISAPLDKVTALEPHMELNLSVTKNQGSGYSFITPFVDAPRRAMTGQT